jgi:hypothetical protein
MSGDNSTITFDDCVTEDGAAKHFASPQTLRTNDVHDRALESLNAVG